MTIHRFARAAVAALLTMQTAAAQTASPPTRTDTVVLRITSVSDKQVRFRGVVTFPGGRAPILLDSLMTPYELRLPAQAIDSRFQAFDGVPLHGEIVTRSGEVSGSAMFVPLRLHFKPGGTFGFEALPPGKPLLP
jgi:hypothetical protein